MSVVFIISAPSGSGKSTLVNRLMQEVPNLCFSISYTTRTPRGHEVEGTSYHFTSSDRLPVQGGGSPKTAQRRDGAHPRVEPGAAPLATPMPPTRRDVGQPAS